MNNLIASIRKILSEQFGDTDVEDFKDALLSLATLNLEDGQVRYPAFNKETDGYLFDVDYASIYIRNKKEMSNRGPFELFILDEDENQIGFIRGTKSGTVISFNLIFLSEESRGSGIGTSIYEHFLDSGFTMKSDSEITDSTYSLYLKLLGMGYTPMVFEDGRVGLKK
jgi:hypothetical protein